jgi:Fe-Mn family superoxide dismutase
MDELHQENKESFSDSIMENISGKTGTMSLKKLCSFKAPFYLDPLPYQAAALEPVIDKETMTIHHDKHHKTYVDNLNKFLTEVKDQPADADLETIFKNISRYPLSVRNNGGGHWNHTFFWTVLTPDEGKRKMPSRLTREIEATFGSLEDFKAQFEKAGTGQFGSGWVWLIRDNSGDLKITSTKNQDNPMMEKCEVKGLPILGVDVWEHAYYLKHHEKRADYLKGIWDAINWDQVNAYDKEILERIGTYQ